MPELRPLSPEKTMLRIIGSGVSFPFKFSEAGRVNSVSVSKGVQKVNQSIHSILTTRKVGKQPPDLTAGEFNRSE